MNKTEFIKAIAEKSGLTAKDAGKFLDGFIEVTTETLSKGDNIALVGFGSFEVAKRAARQARNFKTKEIINVPASKTVRFRVGKGLKESVK